MSAKKMSGEELLTEYADVVYEYEIINASRNATYFIEQCKKRKDELHSELLRLINVAQEIEKLIGWPPDTDTEETLQILPDKELIKKINDIYKQYRIKPILE